MTANSSSVSVVIAAYNQGRYLAGALRSAINQTRPPLEIIVVDDGSTDDTAAVVGSFGDAVHYVWQENQGLAGARNTAIRAATSDYVAFLDSDDEWMPTFLERIMETAEHYPEAAAYYSGWCYVDADGNRLPQEAHTRLVKQDEVYSALLRANFINGSTFVVRRRVFEASGLFDLSFRRLQDWELWLRFAKDGNRFVGLPDCLVLYRLHGSSLSTDLVSGQRAALAAANKHFGPDDDRWDAWSANKRRAYGGAYRYCALKAVLRQDDWRACADNLRRAILIDPSLAGDIDMYYELALGNQPPGYRGTRFRLNLENNASRLLQTLAEIFGPSAPPELQALRGEAFDAAHYTLLLVAYNTGKYHLCPRFMREAVGHNRAMLAHSGALSLTAKSFIRRVLRAA